MLNTRYLIFDLNQTPIRNPHPLGNAWFVSDFKVVGNADDEIKAMESFNLAETAIVDQRFIEHVQGITVAKDRAGKIELTEYQPNYLKRPVNRVLRYLLRKRLECLHRRRTGFPFQGELCFARHDYSGGSAYRGVQIRTEIVLHGK